MYWEQLFYRICPAATRTSFRDIGKHSTMSWSMMYESPTSCNLEAAQECEKSMRANLLSSIAWVRQILTCILVVPLHFLVYLLFFATWRQPPHHQHHAQSHFPPVQQSSDTSYSGRTWNAPSSLYSREHSEGMLVWCWRIQDRRRNLSSPSILLLQKNLLQ